MTEAALSALKAYIDAKIAYELAYCQVGEDGCLITPDAARETLRVAERRLQDVLSPKGAPPQRDSGV